MGMICFGKSWQEPSWWPEPEKPQDDPKPDQIVSESDLIETKEGLNRWAKERTAAILAKHLDPKPHRG